ncbi:MAG: hypothetical protein SA339_07250 [Methanomassiliicoccus sp.]|nr:hypothetical protein [Methanomassiliicoccus sp.]
MDISLEIVLLIAAVAFAAVVGFLELRFLRGRKQVKMDAAIERDDAYNAVCTTKAVAESLRQNGRDTTEADLLIYKAQSAYERREFLDATDMAKRARNILMNCKEKDLISMPSPDPVKAGKESIEVPANQVKKMPANYLESKFIIDSVRDGIPGACDEAKVESTLCLDRAQACFDAEDYDGALKEAMKAKRLLAPIAPAAGKSYPSTVVKLAPPTKIPVAEGPGIRCCPSCRIEALPDDMFCRKCGTRLGS